jgi:hypothetical protein
MGGNGPWAAIGREGICGNGPRAAIGRGGWQSAAGGESWQWATDGHGRSGPWGKKSDDTREI